MHSGRPLGTFGSTSGTTNASGQFQTTYTVSQFAGQETISATVDGASGSATLNIQLSGLSALAAGTNYDLQGAKPVHPSNHFGTATANSHLPPIANQYAAQFPGSKLNYNDMSLSVGGLFDIGPPKGVLWATPHDEHRLGKNCDVSKSNVPSSRWTALTTIFTNNGSPNFLAEADHWHLRF